MPQYELREQLKREPNKSELAAHLDISEAALNKALEKERTFRIMYFEDMANENEDWEQSVPCMDASPEETVERSALIEILGGAIDNLQEKERLVVSLYYYEEMTQKEIAQVLGVTESRVCQIRTAAVNKLKSALKHEWGHLTSNNSFCDG